jgi:phosphoenolpyruvate carboxykinase (ATP)
MSAPSAASFELSAHGLTATTVHHNFSPSALYEHAIRYEKDAIIAGKTTLSPGFGGPFLVWPVV